MDLNKKWKTLGGLLIAGTLLLGARAQASQIGFGGGYVNLTQVGTTTANAGVQFTFGGLSVQQYGDSINRQPFLLTGDFVMTGYVGGSSATFNPSSGNIQFGNATVGELSAAVNFVNITVNNSAFGATYSIDLGLTDISVTSGSSATLNTAQWANAAEGTGVLHFDFSVGAGPPTLAALQDLGFDGYGTGTGHGSYVSYTPTSGTLTANPVPEPATLALLGTGLLGLAFACKRWQNDSNDSKDLDPEA